MSDPGFRAVVQAEPSPELIAAKTRARELDLEQRRADVELLASPELPRALRLAVLGPMLWSTAERLARGAFGERFGGRAESVHGVMLWADGVNVDPVAALQRCYLVHGQVGCEAKLKIAIAAASKVIGPIRWEAAGEHGGTRTSGSNLVLGGTLTVTATATRLDGGGDETETLSLQDAIDNGWTSRGSGTRPSKYESPSMAKRMLIWRTASWLIDRIDPGCVLGMRTDDELRDSAIADGLGPEEPRTVSAAVVPAAATSADELNADFEAEVAAPASKEQEPEAVIPMRTSATGTLEIIEDNLADFIPELAFVPCPLCLGSGRESVKNPDSPVSEMACTRCEGSGEIAVQASELEGRGETVPRAEPQEEGEGPLGPAGEPISPEATDDTPAPTVSPTGRRPRRATVPQADRIRRWAPAIDAAKGAAISRAIIVQEMGADDQAEGAVLPSEGPDWLDEALHPETGLRQAQATRVLKRYEKQSVPFPDGELVVTYKGGCPPAEITQAVKGDGGGKALPEITDPPSEREAPARTPAPPSSPPPFPDGEETTAEPGAKEDQVASIKRAVDTGFFPMEKLKKFLGGCSVSKVSELTQGQARELIELVRKEIVETTDAGAPAEAEAGSLPG